MTDLQSQSQPSIFDKTGCTVMAVVMALFFAYTFLYELPAKQKYQEEIAAWYYKYPDEAPDGHWTANPTLAPEGWFLAHPDQAPEGWFKPGEDPRENGTAPVDSGAVAKVDSTTVVTNPEQPDQPAQPEPAAGNGNPRDDEIAFSTDEHDILLSTRGASVQFLTLKNVLETTYNPKQTSEQDAREPGPYVALHPYLDEAQHFALTPLDDELADAATANWKHESLPGGGHRFTLGLKNGLVLSKTYTRPVQPPAQGADDDEAPPQLYHFDLTVEISNPGAEGKKFGYHLSGPAGIVEQEVGRASYGREFVIATRTPDGKDVEQELDPVAGFESLDTKQPDEALKGTVAYFGTVTKYFAGMVIPTNAAGAGLRPGSQVEQASAMGLVQYAKARMPRDSELTGDDSVGAQGISRGLVPEFTVAPGAKVAHHYAIFVGPRQEVELFESAVYEPLVLGEVVYFGWGIFGSFARILLWFLKGLYSLFGNYGVAILVLTFLVRLGMLPLSVWSQKNMLRMQRLAPEISKLKEKFSKADGTMSPEQQRAFQQAQMDLWRKHGVNPVGCIGPMFLQMPIFIGLYNALNYAVGVRHSEFAFWISDLSIPDVAARLPFTIPLLDTNALSILPLLMVCTYVLQQKIQPAPADEKAAEQQRIMKFVMPVFGFLFYTMPSGLLLYFMTSSLWTIGETLTVKKKIMESEGDGATRKKADKADKADQGSDTPDDKKAPEVSPAEAATGKGKKKKKKSKR